MATSSRKNPPWWDRDRDHTGRSIRDDVRDAAIQIWPRACARTRSALGDVDEAAVLLEFSVAQISRYLDRRDAALFSENANGLLMVAFCRVLGHHAARRRRFQPFGDAIELAQLLSVPDAIDLVDLRLDVEKIIRQLSKRGCTIIALKSAGYEWKSIAQLLRTTAVAARTGFWREVKRARLRAQKAQSIRGPG